MSYLSSNNDVSQAGIYAGVAGIGIAGGAALAVRGTSDIYGNKKKNKDKAMAQEVVENKGNTKMKKVSQAAGRIARRGR